MASQAPPQYVTTKVSDIHSDCRMRRLRQRIAISILFFVNGFGFANLPTRLPELQRFYNVTNTGLGLILLCSSVGALAAMLFANRLLARFGSRRVAMVTALSFAAVPPFLTFIPHLNLLLPLFFALGAAVGALEVAMNDQAVSLEKRFKIPLMNAFHAVFSIGGGAGAALGAAMAWGNVSIFNHFLTVAIGSVGLLVWAAFNLPKTVQQQQIDPNLKHTSGSHSITSQRLAVLPLALIAFGSMASEGTLSNWAALFCSHDLHATASESASAFAVFSIAMTIGRLSGDAFTRRVGQRKQLILSSLTAFIGLLILFLSTHLGVAIAGLAVAGLGFSTIIPLTYSAAGNTEGVSSAVGVSMISMVGYASFFIMPPVVGLLSDAWGLRWAMGVLLILVAAVFLLAVHLKPQSLPTTERKF